MWLPSFALIIDDRLDNQVTQKSVGIPYKYVVRYYGHTTFSDDEKCCKNCVDPGTKRAKTAKIVSAGQKCARLEK